MRSRHLFAEDATIHDVVEHQRRNLERTLEELPGQTILARPLEELVAEVTATFRLDVPVLDRAGTVQLPNEEVDIDVSDDAGDPILYGSDVAGTSVGIVDTGSLAGDNNGNHRLDVGDASLLMRLIAQISLTRKPLSATR